MGTSPLLLLLMPLLLPSLADEAGGAGRAPWSPTHTDYLKRLLLAGYDKFARPAHHRASTNVTIALQANHVELDDASGVMALHGWVSLTWNDDKLQWNASDYGGLDTLHVADHEIWQPDIVQYNSASGNVVDQYGNTHCLVKSDGTVLWVPPAKLTTFCHMDLSSWPVDRQTCHFLFGSWTYDGLQIDLHTDQLHDVDLSYSYFVTNPQWSLERISAERQERHYSCCEETYVHVQYSVAVRRLGAARLGLLRAQATAAVLLALLAHALPSARAAPRAVLAAAPAALLALALLQLARRLPPAARAPAVLRLYAGALYVVCASAVLSVVALNLARSRRALPAQARRVLAWRVVACLVSPETSAAHDCSMTEELAGGSEPGGGGGGGSARAWPALAAALDRAGALLLGLVFALLLLVYSC